MMMNALKKVNPQTVEKMIVIVALFISITLSVGVTTRGGDQTVSTGSSAVVVDVAE